MGGGETRPSTAAGWRGLGAEQSRSQVRSREREVRGHVAEDGPQGPDPEGGVIRHGDVVLPPLRGREADVAPGPPRDG